jgi:hypothetical protein
VAMLIGFLVLATSRAVADSLSLTERIAQNLALSDQKNQATLTPSVRITNVPSEAKTNPPTKQISKAPTTVKVTASPSTVTGAARPAGEDPTPGPNEDVGWFANDFLIG